MFPQNKHNSDCSLPLYEVPATVPNLWVVLDSPGTLSPMPTPGRSSKHLILHGILRASEGSQLREMGKNCHIFHMSLELKSLSFTIARSRWHILLPQIGFKVRCI